MIKSLKHGAMEALLGLSPLEPEEDEDMQPSCSEDVFQDTEYPLHRAAFENDIPTLRSLLERDASASQRISTDPQGNTALHVAVLKHNYEAIELLLAYNFSVEARNSHKWNPLDEAVALKDSRATKLLLEKFRVDIKKERKERKPKLLAAMQDVPSFTMQLKWDLGSPLFGLLLKQVAPYDTYTIYKHGTYLRVDGSLRGLDPHSYALLPRWRRGPFSLVVDASVTPVAAHLLDHTDSTYIDLYAERKAAVVDIDEDVKELIEAGAGRVRLKSSEINMTPVKTTFRRQKTATVDGWDAEVYEASGQLVAVVLQKTPVVIPGDANWEEYLMMELPKDESVEVPWDPLSKEGLPSIGTAVAEAAEKEAAGKDWHKSSKSRHVSARFWMAKHFPLTVQQLVPFMDAIGSANKHIATAATFIASYNQMSMFPIKFQIPLMWTVHLMLRFKRYRELKQGDDAVKAEFYHVPAGYTRMLLKDAWAGAGIEDLEQKSTEEEEDVA